VRKPVARVWRVAGRVAAQLGIKRVVLRRRRLAKHATAQHLQMADLANTKLDLPALRQRFQDAVEVAWQDTPGAHIVAKYSAR